jgi:hypothetical protein
LTTPGRYYALQWFADHEDLGATAVLTRKSPSKKMRGWMLREGQLKMIPRGQFSFHNSVLTAEGRAALAKKPKPRRRPNAQRYQEMLGASRGELK